MKFICDNEFENHFLIQEICCWERINRFLGKKIVIKHDLKDLFSINFILVLVLNIWIGFVESLS